MGSSSDIEMIFKSLKVSVLNDLEDNIETHLQQISKELKENTVTDFSGSCVEFSKYSILFQNVSQLPLLKLVWCGTLARV